jgi:hypothetical protein
MREQNLVVPVKVSYSSLVVALPGTQEMDPTKILEHGFALQDIKINVQSTTNSLDLLIRLQRTECRVLRFLAAQRGLVAIKRCRRLLVLPAVAALSLGSAFLHQWLRAYFCGISNIGKNSQSK